ncbi:MAG: glycosylhydrolase-like jelly roll fold domain-containing protein, partial [Spartobacteria bacterium]
RYLVLPDHARLVPADVEAIKRLAEAGATLIGPAPTRSPSLKDFPQADQEVRTLAAEIWPADGKPGERRIGKGRVITGKTFEEILAADGLTPDFSAQASADANIHFIHRILPEGDLYFVCNLLDRAETAKLRFRTTGRTVEIWDAQTGAIVKNVVATDDGQATSVTVPLQPHESRVFFLNDKAKTAGAPVAIRESQPTDAKSIEGPWSVSFPVDRGGPAEAVVFDKLTSWTDHADERIKHFSGTATYRKTIQLEKPKSDTKLLLDLGNLPHLAEVILNGKNLGVVWMKPAVVDITSAAKSGNNDLEIRVTNVWKNRMVGDAKLEPAKRITWSNWTFYKGNEPLEVSGLLGPVSVSTMK